MTGSNSKALRVLVVEDHHDSATAMSRLLRAFGHQPEVAGTYASAIALANAGNFDLLISDLSLPDGNGLDLMRHVSGAGATRGIAISGYVSPTDERASLDAGFSMHLGKPIDFEKLRAAIEEVMSD